MWTLLREALPLNAPTRQGIHTCRGVNTGAARCAQDLRASDLVLITKFAGRRPGDGSGRAAAVFASAGGGDQRRAAHRRRRCCASHRPVQARCFRHQRRRGWSGAVGLLYIGRPVTDRTRAKRIAHATRVQRRAPRAVRRQRSRLAREAGERTSSGESRCGTAAPAAPRLRPAASPPASAATAAARPSAAGTLLFRLGIGGRLASSGMCWRDAPTPSLRRLAIPRICKIKTTSIFFRESRERGDTGGGFLVDDFPSVGHTGGGHLVDDTAGKGSMGNADWAVGVDV